MQKQNKPIEAWEQSLRSLERINNIMEENNITLWKEKILTEISY